MRKTFRAVAIIINKNKILLMHRIKSGEEFYVFPGGSVESEETIEKAVLREVIEETSVQVKIEKLLYHHIYDNNHEQFYYLCYYLSGEPKLGEFNEIQEMREGGINSYNPKWKNLDELPKLLLYPLEIRDWLIEDIKSDFKNTPKKAELKISELRQKK